MIKISRAGSFRRPVVVIGRSALTFARNLQGRRCNVRSKTLSIRFRQASQNAPSCNLDVAARAASHHAGGKDGGRRVALDCSTPAWEGG